MPNHQKLYQILEKAHIDTKIAVEIQDWIVDTIEEKRDLGMTHFQESKLLPMHQEMRTGFDFVHQDMNQRFDFIREEMNRRFESMQTTMDARFESFQTTMDARFESVQSTMDARFKSIDARFDSLEKRLDATNFSIRLLGVPIVGATIGGLGIIFLQIYERLAGS